MVYVNITHRLLLSSPISFSEVNETMEANCVD